MFPLSFAEAAEAMEARVVTTGADGALPALSFPEVSIDTRTLQPGQAFFALRGERYDGHDFIPGAVKAGASVLVLSTVPLGTTPRLPVLLVEDTTLALQSLARSVRRRWGRPLLAITGSMGKTTTRAFTAALLSKGYSVLQSQGNFNNHVGLPLSLLCLEEEYELAVLELAMNHAGEIDTLARICEPTAALLTNIAPVHLEFFESIDAIARAKAEIIAALEPTGTVFYNRDDARVRKIAAGWDGRKVSFGFDADSDFRINAWSVPRLGETRLSILGPTSAFEESVQVTGKHFLYAVAAAISVAATFEVSDGKIREALSELRPAQRRGEIIRLGKLTLWDDSYNSNPCSVHSVLETLQKLLDRPRTVLILGDMLELGHETAAFHRKVGKRAAEIAGLLLTVGPLSRETGFGALEGGFPACSHYHFETAREATEALASLLREGDLIVVKGSRAVGLDRVAEALKGGAE